MTSATRSPPLPAWGELIRVRREAADMFTCDSHAGYQDEQHRDARPAAEQVDASVALRGREGTHDFINAIPLPLSANLRGRSKDRNERQWHREQRQLEVATPHGDGVILRGAAVTRGPAGMRRCTTRHVSPA